MKNKQISFYASEHDIKDLELIKQHLMQTSNSNTIRMMIQIIKKNLGKAVTKVTI